MRKSVLIAVATVSLLGACRQGEVPANNETPDSNVTGELSPRGGPSIMPEEAQAVFHERHEGMEAIGKSTKTIKQALDSGSPDMGAIRAASAKIDELAGKSSGWFPAGTDKTLLPKTRALPAIWGKPDDFAAKDRDFQQAASALKSAAEQGDVDAVRDQFAALGKTCKACHDTYRAEKHPQ